MPDQRTALDTLYFVDGSEKDVVLEIITGGVNQTSTMSIFIDDTAVAENQHGGLQPTVIGTNRTLAGKILTVACNIADTSRDTNFTELRVRLNGGILFMEHPLFATVETEGDSVDYLCIVRFFKP